MKTCITVFMFCASLFAQFPFPGSGGSGGGGGGGGSTLPGVSGQGGRFLSNDGTSPGWQDLTTASVKDCAATLSSGTLTLAACAARNGNLDTSVAACTLSLTGTSASGTIYGFLSGSGSLTLGHNSAATAACTGWTVVTGVSSFPEDALPLFTATFSANVWTVGGVTPYRRMVARDQYTAGDGLISSNNSSTGVTAIAVDGTQIPRYFTGAGVPTQNCTQGRDLFLNASGPSLYQCTATNTWAAVGGGGSYSKVSQQAYITAGSRTDGGTNIFGPISCDASAGCFSDSFTAGARQWQTVAFSDSGTTLSSSAYHRLPANWDGGTVALSLEWTRNSGAGTNVVFSVRTACIASTEDALTTTYNTEQTAVSAAPSPGSMKYVDFSSITMTGCVTGETLILRVGRKSGDASDDIAANVHLFAVVLTYKVNLTN